MTEKCRLCDSTQPCVVHGRTPVTSADWAELRRDVAEQLFDYDACDPGIRDVVLRVRQAGFETTDSGDGVSKPAEWYTSGEAMPFPHVVATTEPERLIDDALRLQAVLGGGWTVEASYTTHDGSAVLLARVLHEREKD